MSTKDRIHISFKLKKGAIDEINKKFGSSHFSPLEDYLYLKKSLTHSLNLMNDNGTVQEFKTYEDVMKPWFKEREALYPVRIERECILIRLKIKLRTEILRYIEIHEKLELRNKKRSDQDKILKTNNFPQFNTVRLNKPDVPNDKIEKVVLGENATYKYLLLNHEDMSDESIDKIKLEIKKLNARLSELSQPDAVYKIWKQEISNITTVIDNAICNGWVKEEDW